MRWSFNTLLARLLIGSGIPLVLFAVVGLVSAVVITRLLTALRIEKHTHEVISHALLLRHHLDAMRLAAETVGPTELGRTRRFRTDRAEFDRFGARLRELVEDNTEQERRIEEILEDSNSLLALLERQGREGPVTVDMLFAQIDDQIGTFIDAEQVLLDKRRARTETQTRQAVPIVAASVCLGLALTVALSLAAARSVTLPVGRLREAAGQLMHGSCQSVPPAGPTEIADLIVLFNHMALTLSQRAGLLEQQHERYRTWIGALAHILWNTDATGQVTSDLPTWRAFTGQSEQEVRGQGWLDALHPEDRARVESAWHSAVRSGRVFEAECRLRSAAGEYRYFNCRGVPVTNADGAVREWIGTCTDITEAKERLALEKARDAAEAASRTKSEFLTRMSHELRTPLNAIIGMSRMLATQRFGPLNAKQADYVGDITRAGEHLLLLINDILDLAKVEAGKMDVQPDSFDLASAIEASAATLRPLAEARGIRLLLSQEDSGEVQTDPARFRQVLYNLLSNAIKFTPRGGEVCIRWQWVASARLEAPAADASDAPAFQVAVEDTGIGIAPEDQEAVWDEFRQTRQSSEEYQGTGLGLALTRRLVGLLGGQITLSSTLGQGSTFTFVLPRHLPTEAGVASTAPQDQTRPVVVAVEDHDPTRKLLCDWLSEAGLNAVPAVDGLDGLEKVRQLVPALIVLDISLPRLDGWQVLTALKADPRTASIPVVIVTVDEQCRPASPLAVQEFLVKPVDRETFLQRLRRVAAHLFQQDSPHRVLVVDDDPTARKLMADLLQSEGLEVIVAADGQEALTQLDQVRPDLVLLDLLMPQVDGFAVVEQIRSRAELADLPVVVITARDLSPDDRARLNGRIQALLGKHVLSPERLREHLAALGLLCHG